MTPDTYLDAKANTALLEDFTDPYYEAQQILTDEEHGWDATDRLYAFDMLLKAHADASEEQQNHLFAWLSRYIWAIRYPTYTEGAIRTLRQLRLPDDVMLAVTLDILNGHPHGLARAAVIHPSEDYQPWIQDDAMQDRLEALAFDDPHPEVRRFALQLVEARLPFERLRRALAHDPAAEVRAELARRLARDSKEDPETEPALRAALFDPQNAAILPEMTLTYLSSGTVKQDMTRLAHGLTAYHNAAQNPLRADMVPALKWQLDEAALPLLASGAPYADAEALVQWMQATAQDPDQPLVNRSLLLHTLSRQPGVVLDATELAAFLQNPDHTSESLEPLFDLSLGSTTLRRVLSLYADDPATFAKSYLAFLSGPKSTGKPRASDTTLIGALFEFDRLLKSLSDDDQRTAITNLLLATATAHPGSIVYGVEGLLTDRTMVSDDRFMLFAQTVENDFAFRDTLRAFATRLRPGPWQDPAPQGNDMALAVQLVTIASERYPEDPDDAYQALYDLIYALPVKTDLPTDLVGLDRFEAALRALRDRAEREDGHWATDRWLGAD